MLKDEQAENSARRIAKTMIAGNKPLAAQEFIRVTYDYDFQEVCNLHTRIHELVNNPKEIR